MIPEKMRVTPDIIMMVGGRKRRVAAVWAGEARAAAAARRLAPCVLLQRLFLLPPSPSLSQILSIAHPTPTYPPSKCVTTFKERECSLG